MKIYKKIMLVFGASMLLTNCTKEKVELNSPKTEDSVQYLLNGEKKIDMTDIEWTDQTHFVEYEGQNVAFDTDEAFLNWAKSTEHAELFTEKFNYIVEMQEFAEGMNLIDDEQATLEYMENIANPNTAVRRGGTLVYDRTNFNTIISNSPTGVVFAFGASRNRAESIIPTGVGALCDKNWFKGAKRWFFRIPIANLGSFRNKANSMF
ncbi:MAG: hypothetical protein ACPGVD_07965 [Flavobacteriales bacterium]